MNSTDGKLSKSNIEYNIKQPVHNWGEFYKKRDGIGYYGYIGVSPLMD